MEATDQELIDRSLSGSPAAFDRLMERHQKAVYRLARGYGRSHEDALDITQNVFLRAFHHLAAFQGRSRFRTWLLSIACRESATWLRGERRHPADPGPEVDFDALPAGDDHERDLLAGEQRASLYAQIGDLAPRRRLAVVLRYFHDLPIRDIAAILGCSEVLVRNLLFRSLRRLRAGLAALQPRENEP